MTGPVICAPLRVEARALRRGLQGLAENGHPTIDVRRTGYGPAKAAEAAARLEPTGGGLAVGGVAGALSDDLSVGDLVVASEVRADLALLQLARVPAGAHPAQLGDSALTMIGEQIFIVGAPYGIAHALTVGYVSARHKPRTIYSEMGLAEFIQTDAAINQGNSGGPMFNMKGEVIGIVSHIISKSGGFEGLGFVVSSNMARQLMLETRPFWSGVTWFKVSGELAEYLNLPQPFGLAVEEVAKNSPAEAIGLRASRVIARIEGRDVPLGGDIVLASMGITLESEESFHKVRERQAQLRSGDELTYRVFRAGKVIELKGRLP